MEYTKDKGTIKPDLWGKYEEKELEKEERVENRNGEKGNMVQPIIYIINADPRMLQNIYGMNRDMGRRGVGNIISNIFYFLYKVKNIIKTLLVVGIIIMVIVLISNPEIINNFVINILKKTGLYSLIMGIKKIMR